MLSSIPTHFITTPENLKGLIIVEDLMLQPKAIYTVKEEVKIPILKTQAKECDVFKSNLNFANIKRSNESRKVVCIPTYTAKEIRIS